MAPRGVGWAAFLLNLTEPSARPRLRRATDVIFAGFVGEVAKDGGGGRRDVVASPFASILARFRVVVEAATVAVATALVPVSLLGRWGARAACVPHHIQAHQ
jgi:hypothetical protein